MDNSLTIMVGVVVVLLGMTLAVGSEDEASVYERRVNDAAARFNELRQRFAGPEAAAPSGAFNTFEAAARFSELGPRLAGSEVLAPTDTFVAAQRARLGQHIIWELDRTLAPVMNRQLQAYWHGKGGRLQEINFVERAFGPLELYIDSWVAFSEYIPKFGADPYVIYTLDPTCSYRILPAGPEGHNEELSYYWWGAADVGFPNPQILPHTSPVPAIPSRRLEAFGCRRQYIPLSFAVQAGEPMPELRFEVSALRDGNKTLPPETVDLRVVKAWWRPYADHYQLPVFLNELLVHDDEFVTARDGVCNSFTVLTGEPVNHFKNAKFANDLPKLTPVSIPEGQTRQFWVTVHVPEEAETGRYRGEIKATSGNGHKFNLSLTIEVLPFDLEPTPFAYSFFYRSYLRSEEEKQEQGVHSRYKTADQMQKEFINMAQHGLNTLCTYDGAITKTETGWDFSRLRLVLDMGTKAGLTRSPFVWLGHPLQWRSEEGREGSETIEQVIAKIQEVVPAVDEFLADNGYPRAAFFGVDERSGEELRQLKRSYQAVKDAGGLATVATFDNNYFERVGTALSLPIVYGGAALPEAERSIRASQAAGYECWIYGCPQTDMAASPAVYRRRYGLAMWRNGEDGVIDWEYSGHGRDLQPYMEKPEGRIYAVAYPTWEGTPIDTIIYEAFREGIYDTRYLATLLKYRDIAREEGKAEELVKQVNKWLDTFSVQDDLQQVRGQMVQWIQQLHGGGQQD